MRQSSMDNTIHSGGLLREIITSATWDITIKPRTVFSEDSLTENAAKPTEARTAKAVSLG